MASNVRRATHDPDSSSHSNSQDRQTWIPLLSDHPSASSRQPAACVGRLHGGEAPLIPCERARTDSDPRETGRRGRDLLITVCLMPSGECRLVIAVGCTDGCRRSCAGLLFLRAVAGGDMFNWVSTHQGHTKALACRSHYEPRTDQACQKINKFKWVDGWMDWWVGGWMDGITNISSINHYF